MKRFKIFIKESKVEERIPLKVALSLAKEVIQKLKLKYLAPTDVKEDTKGKLGYGIPVGSIRQENPTIGDIDIVVTEKINMKQIETLKGVDRIWARGVTQIFFDYTSSNGISRPINLWILTNMEHFGGMMMHTTGPQDYNITLRRILKKQGLLGNQYGVFDGSKQLGGNTEGNYLSVIKTKNHPEGLPWKPPSLRGK